MRRVGKPTVEQHLGRSVGIRCVLQQFVQAGRQPHCDGIWVQQSNNTSVQLSATRQPLGGVRWWLLCPVCERQTTRLYSIRGLSCRTCAGLSYRSTRQGPIDRYKRRAAKYIRKMGGWLGERPSSKPKRMRWSTFERLEALAAHHEAAADAIFMSRMDRDLGRFVAAVQRRQGG